MTKVTFAKKDGLYSGFHLVGHAGYNLKGPDILCSAISMGAQMTELGLRKVSKIETIIHENDGEFSVFIKGKDCSNEGAQILIETLCLSLQTLEAQYPAFIKVNVVGE